MFGVRDGLVRKCLSNFLRLLFHFQQAWDGNSERRNNAKRCEFGVLPATRRMRSVASLAFSKTGVYSELGERNNAKRCEIETLCFQIRVSPTC